MSIHDLIDDFVSVIDPAGTNFRRVESAPWIDVLESKLQKRFPVSFLSLVTRYTFPPFEAGGIAFFANTGADSDEDLGVAMFNDRNITDATLADGYIQIGRPAGGSYDPICFYAGQRVHNREFPIVRLDHEEILCNNRTRVSEVMADSFYRMAMDLVSRV